MPLAKQRRKLLAEPARNSWFFIAADYAFGRSQVKDATAGIERVGGQVLGAVYAPLATSDFSSFLLQARASKAEVIGLANGPGDVGNVIKQVMNSLFKLSVRGTPMEPSQDTRTPDQ